MRGYLFSRCGAPRHQHPATRRSRSAQPPHSRGVGFLRLASLPRSRQRHPHPSAWWPTDSVTAEPTRMHRAGRCVLDRLTRLFDDYRISQRYIESHHPCSLLIHACCCASCLHARLMLSAHAIRGIAIIVIMCCRACCFGAPPVTAHHPIHLHQVTAVRTRRNDVTFTFNRYESLHHRRPHIFAISRFIIRVCLMLLELAMMVDCSP